MRVPDPDFCKDNQLDSSGAINTFKKVVKAIIATKHNVILTSDHSGEEFLPYFEVSTRPKSIYSKFYKSRRVFNPHFVAKHLFL